MQEEKFEPVSVWHEEEQIVRSEEVEEVKNLPDKVRKERSSVGETCVKTAKQLISEKRAAANAKK